MGGLEIRVLGELEVLQDGTRVALPASKKTRALLGFLAITGRAHTREALTELLWGVPDDPRAALRWCLTKIRPLVDAPKAPRLLADRERVELDRGAVEIDLASVRSSLKSATSSAEELEALADRFRGDLLDGLELPDCYRYHAWWAAEREAARRTWLEILDGLLARYEARPEDQLRVARRRIAVDPFADLGHASTIRALGRLGRGKEALAHYDSYCKMIARELSAQPSPEVERARAGLSAQTTPAAAVTPAPVAVPATSVLPLVGRDDELSRIDRFLTAHGAPVLLLAGDPGIGKSRLAEELSKKARALGRRVLLGRAFEAELARPYGPLFDAVEQSGGGQLARLAEPGAPLPDRSHIFEAVLAHLRGLGPTLLIIDDIQWIDEGSTALLHYLVRSAEPNLSWALTLRPGELTDNPPALRLVRALSREAGVERIDLPPLGDEAIALLVKSVGRDVSAEKVKAEGGGNPFFVIEVARALAAGSTSMSGSLADRLAERLDRLGDSARELIGWAAAFGRVFALEPLALASGAEAFTLLAAAEELERRGLIRAQAGSQRYDFAHDLFRGAAYRKLSEPRRRLIHLRIARALAPASIKETALAGDVAHHAAQGGDDELAAQACIIAGRHCFGLSAFDEAIELANRGKHHAAKLPEQTRLELQAELLHLWIRPGLPLQDSLRIEAEAAELTKIAIARGLETIAASATIVSTFLSYLRGNHQDAFERARSLVTPAKQTLNAGVSAARVAQAAHCLVELEREIPRAQALLVEAQRLAAAANAELAEIFWAAGGAAYFAGDHAAALTLLDRAIGLTKIDHWIIWESISRIGRIAIETRAPRLILDREAAFNEAAQKLGGGIEPVITRATLALATRLDGGPSSKLEEVLGELARAGGAISLAYLASEAAYAEVEAGHREEAQARIGAWAENIEVHGKPSDRLILSLTKAELALLEGRRAEAEALGQAVATALTPEAEVRTIVRRRHAALTAKLNRQGASDVPDDGRIRVRKTDHRR